MYDPILSKYASVGEEGSISLGKNTVVDGYKHGREIGVFSHVHSDHLRLFPYAMQECTAIYLSPPTFDLISAIEQNIDDSVSAEAYFGGRHIYRLDYNTPIIPKTLLRNLSDSKEYSDQIELREADHILGSSQVLVTTDDGKKIVYSSDFTYPNTKPIPCDALVLDATHGDPRFNAVSDGPSLENRLVELVDNEIVAGNPICIRAHVGRLQYIMSILSEKIPPNVSFLAAAKYRKLAPIYKKYGMPIRDLIESDSYEGETVMEQTYPFIEFKTVQAAKSESEMDGRSAVFTLGGVYLGAHTTIRQSSTNSKHYNIEFGDHGSYDNIIKYVKDSSPSLVITDGFRSGWGSKLAEKIKEELGIDTMSQPST
jgi:Cft2 family RNA processing exonuclease